MRVYVWSMPGQHLQHEREQVLLVGAGIEIVYYAPREEKTWTVAFGSGVNSHELWAGQFYSRGAYTIFPHIEAENDIFPFRSRAGMRHFRPGVRKIHEQAD